MGEWYPFLTLLVGMTIVLGLIIRLKINAFLALIAAAMAVSLMAPGPWADKISRVAAAFGTQAGNIAIIIALAAIIGQCMMDSGAADRVVRAFLRMMGDERAPTALMASGYVLAIPVFFDTVFYLLVPLARSLHKRTHRHYLRYLLAIAAGGAITHTLVPPTPGPLLMAATLDIDVGLMILMGMSVAIVAAAAGLTFAKACDRWMPIPMRPLPGVEETAPLPDSALPPLWLAAAPVVLPVLLISANTALSTWADLEYPARLTSGQVRDAARLIEPLRQAAQDAADGQPQVSPAGRIVELLSDETRPRLIANSLAADEAGRDALLHEINQHILPRPFLHQPAETYFDEVLPRAEQADKRLGEIAAQLAAEPDADERRELEIERERLAAVKEAQKFLAANRDRMKKADVERLNRRLLEASFPGALEPMVWETDRRRAADFAALLGNTNLALLLSTVVALAMYYRQRKPTVTQLAHTVETALMSGGVIILITSAGGAFGSMLQEARLGDAIRSFSGTEGPSAGGLMLLLMAYLISTVFKVAQGSSTVAMITTSAIMAAMIGSGSGLPFHPVYIALAIGSGSLMGSWMNDSGFWVFAKMGGLTELEAFKSWSILLAVLGITGMVMTLLLATLLPLTA